MKTKLLKTYMFASLSFPIFFSACDPSSSQDTTVTVKDMPATITSSADTMIREIKHIAGDIYRVQIKNHMSLIIETEDSIVLVDPINADAANWMKAEIKKRFNKPISHILYSHAHWDHATGAKQIPDAIVIGHSDADEVIKSGGERAVNIRPPDQTYSNDINRLKIGGKVIEMHHVPNRHATDMSYIYIPDEGVVFIVDVISLGAIPYGTLSYYELSDFNNIYQKALGLNAEVIVGGHGKIGTNEDIHAMRGYMSKLRRVVQSRMQAGKSLGEIKVEILQEGHLDEYKDWLHFERVSGNVEGIYNALGLEAQAAE